MRAGQHGRCFRRGDPSTANVARGLQMIKIASGVRCRLRSRQSKITTNESRRCGLSVMLSASASLSHHNGVWNPSHDSHRCDAPLAAAAAASAPTAALVHAAVGNAYRLRARRRRTGARSLGCLTRDRAHLPGRGRDPGRRRARREPLCRAAVAGRDARDCGRRAFHAARGARGDRRRDGCDCRGHVDAGARMPSRRTISAHSIRNFSDGAALTLEGRINRASQQYPDREYVFVDVERAGASASELQRFERHGSPDGCGRARARFASATRCGSQARCALRATSAIPASSTTRDTWRARESPRRWC